MADAVAGVVDDLVEVTCPVLPTTSVQDHVVEARKPRHLARRNGWLPASRRRALT